MLPTVEKAIPDTAQPIGFFCKKAGTRASKQAYTHACAVRSTHSIVFVQWTVEGGKSVVCGYSRGVWEMEGYVGVGHILTFDMFFSTLWPESGLMEL